MSDDETDFHNTVRKRIDEINEAAARWKREHPEEDKPAARPATAATAGNADAKRAKAEVQLAQWEDAMRATAEENGGLIPPRPACRDPGAIPAVRLDERPAELAAGRPLADTESLLNDLIVECRSLLRDVAFRSACLTPDPDDRIRFLAAAQNLALTGANVGKVVAKLRASNQPAVEERRLRMIYEHTQTSTPSPRVDSPRKQKQRSTSCVPRTSGSPRAARLTETGTPGRRARTPPKSAPGGGAWPTGVSACAPPSRTRSGLSSRQPRLRKHESRDSRSDTRRSKTPPPVPQNSPAATPSCGAVMVVH